MKRITRTHMVVCLTTLLLGACSSTPEKDEQEAVMAKQEPTCLYPDDAVTTAPDWICGAPYKDYKLTAVGSHEKTAAGFDFQKTMAAASARGFLARQMKVTVQDMVKRYNETTGSADSETVDRVNASVSKQITDEQLIGSRILMSRVNPKTKTLFVIVGLDAEHAERVAKYALQTSMSNEKALWQQFRSKQSFEELSEEIAKLKP